MTLKIRMARAGAKKRPFFHIVIADSRNPRDGRFIERIGTYNPMLPKEHEKRACVWGGRARRICVGLSGGERDHHSVRGGVMEGTVEVNGVNLWYDVAGEGEPVVQIHGAGFGHFNFAPATPELAKHFRVVDYDMQIGRASCRERV